MNFNAISQQTVDDRERGIASNPGAEVNDLTRLMKKRRRDVSACIGVG
jgi:hypothetical protein